MINKDVVRETAISNYPIVETDNSMIIYLYIKQHNITGLKYLGKTTAKNPHTYPGSGTYWRSHLNVHGYNYTTEILRECNSKEEVKEWGSYYSKLWDVVKSPDWANLKPEEGDGGGLKGEMNPRYGKPGTFLGRKHSDVTKKKMSRKKAGKTYEEIYGESSAYMKQVRAEKSRNRYVKESTRKLLSSIHKGKIVSEESKKKMSKAHKGKQCGCNNPRAKTINITDPFGNHYVVKGELKKFCKEHKLGYSTVHLILSTGRSFSGSTNGWIFSYE